MGANILYRNWGTRGIIIFCHLTVHTDVFTILHEERQDDVLGEPLPVEVHVVALHLPEVQLALLVQALQSQPVLSVEGQGLEVFSQDVLVAR